MTPGHVLVRQRAVATSSHLLGQSTDVTAPLAQVTPNASEATNGTSRSLPLSLYWKLAKGKLTVWVSLSATPGYLLAVPGAVDPFVLASLLAGTFLTSSSAQTMNQMFEVKRDALMKRTASRPLPSGQLTMREAACFATGCGVTGLGLLSMGTTPATAGVAALTMAIYVAMYTPMKVRSPYNTHVGAISGSLPTLMGFTAALGAGLVVSPWAPHAAWLFGMQTLWQMPHFYALAWLYRSDYIAGGYNMFPLTDTTGDATAAMSKPYLVALCALPWALSAFGCASWMFPVGAALPSAFWWHSLRRFEEKPSSATCRRFFLGSLSYLLSMLALFALYARVDEKSEGDSCSCSGGLGKDCHHCKQIEAHHASPSWQARIQSYLLEACPHQKASADLLGEGKNGCPFC